MSKMVEQITNGGQSAQNTQNVTVYGNQKTPDTNSQDGYRLPETTTLIHAAKLAIVEDKPILLDYWTQSLEKTVLIGVKDGGESTEKLLVKSEDEYTSPISKIFGAGKEYIIITENSIYIVDKGIPTKRISA
jgi:hypothetical protein